METLVAVLFIIFSIGSALLERRKRRQRRQQVEKGGKVQKREAQRQAEEASSGPQRVEVDVAEEEEEWSFPSGGFDPFELQPAKPDPALLEIERQQHEAERLAAEAERKARQLEEQAQRRKESSATQAHYGTKRTGIKRKGRLIFETRNVRDAIVYAEILGPPKAEREDNV
jgi:hypothetical protein